MSAKEIDMDTTGLSGINLQMGGLARALEEEYGKLKENWAQFLAEKDAFDTIRDRIETYTAGELERLKLNVGGHRFEIRASCVQKNTYFRTVLSGTFTPADPDGFYFIDRDPQYMPVVMSMLREGDVDLDDYSDKDLEKIRKEAEFYMVEDLSRKIDQFRQHKRAGTGIVAVPLNFPCETMTFFNGVFFEITVTRPDFRLHGISFVCGESRKIVGEAFLKEGSIDAPAIPKKIGDVEQTAERGSLVSIDFSCVPLTGMTYTIGVYSSSCPTAIGAVPQSFAARDFSDQGFAVTKSYHTTNPRGHWTKRAGEDEFDFVGELAVSFA